MSFGSLGQLAASLEGDADQLGLLGFHILQAVLDLVELGPW